MQRGSTQEQEESQVTREDYPQTPLRVKRRATTPKGPSASGEKKEVLYPKAMD